MSNALQIQKLKDLTFIEEQNNYPSFTWQGNTYKFNPSITEFKRQTDTGGYNLVRLMTATVRLYDLDQDDELIPLFPSGTPKPQNVFTYSLDNTNYRIESIKPEKSGAYFRITAHSTTKMS
jgi:hypothetical protein